MKKTFFARFAIGIVVLYFNCTLVTASIIVDTGIPTNSNPIGFHGNPIDELWWAGRFTLQQSSDLTDIDYYLTPLHDGTVTAAIYSGIGVPIPGSELFSATFQGASSGPTDWYGISGINWTLSPGTYWVAFEARAKDGYWSTLPLDVPFPLEAVAAYRPSFGGYVLETPESFGIRISGNINPVPVPGAIWLFGSGFAGLAIGLRRKGNQRARIFRES